MSLDDSKTNFKTCKNDTSSHCDASNTIPNLLTYCYFKCFNWALTTSRSIASRWFSSWMHIIRWLNDKFGDYSCYCDSKINGNIFSSKKNLSWTHLSAQVSKLQNKLRNYCVFSISFEYGMSILQSHMDSIEF